MKTLAPRHSRPRIRFQPQFGSVIQLAFGRQAPLTDRVFLDLCRENPDLRLERTAQGELIVMAPAGGESGWRNSQLTCQLQLWSNASKLGLAFDSSAGFRLPNSAILSPDAAWVEQSRWDALTKKERSGWVPLCPDFVVEIRSQTDPLVPLQEKMLEYINQGARLAWLIDPFRRVVEVYRPGKRKRTIKGPKTVSGGDVLPGFVLDLQGILTD